MADVTMKGTCTMALLFLCIVALAVLVFVLDMRRNPGDGSDKKPSGREWFTTPEYKQAGVHGEEAAVRAIESVLREDDHLLTNVNIEYENKPAELDIVIVNKYGVFIFEVKNYSGHIVGKEDDYEWQKYKTTEAGNTYEKRVKNPIKQVKRQIYILAHYLEYYGLRVWVKGYAILLQDNSPVNSDYILHGVADIERVIHTRDRTMLSVDTVGKVLKLLR